MITLENLNLSDNDEIALIKKIYNDSFPHSERRPFDTMIDLYNHHQKYNIQLVKHDDKVIGLLTFWDLGEFIFAEHFAIAADTRNEGLGTIAMNLFMDEQTKPIILEVEIPVTTLAERRIGFYQRLGYKLWDDYRYHQPSYHSNGNPIPMYLMTWDKIDLDKKFSDIKQLIYTEIYNY